MISTATSPQSADQQDRFYRQAHRVASGCATLHLMICLALGIYNGSWPLALLVGVPAVLLPWLLARAEPSSLASRLAMCAGFMMLTGSIIQQSGGDIAAHFSFFIMISVLVVYCDWRPLLLALVLIALHHFGFTLLQQSDTGMVVFGNGGWLWGHFFVHAAAATAQTLTLCYLAVVLRRLVAGSIAVAEMAEHIAAGRMDIRVASTGALGHAANSELLTTFTLMQQRLAAMLGQVSTSAHAMGDALGEISSGTDNLAHRTELNADRTQATAAEVRQFVEGTLRTLQITSEAEHASEIVGQSAEQAGGTVARVVETMHQIDASSKRIAEIISVIDGIAFQTNILALNAAVEAARAGDHGRGFAVVASEVRGLAQRSAQAAKEIRVLITGATDSVSRGRSIVQEAGEQMERVVASVRHVRQLMTEATRAAQADQPRLQRINLSLQEIDSTMQQNAAFVDQMSSSTQALRSQETALLTALHTFLDDRSQAGEAAVAA